MASSISVPCSKSSVIGPQRSRNRNSKPQTASISASFLAGSARIAKLQGSNRNHFPVLKAQIHEVSTDRTLSVLKFFLSWASVLLLKPIFHLKASMDGSSNSSPLPSSQLKTPSSNRNDSKIVEDAAPQSLSDINIAALMAEVSDLVKLVDSRDITELKLKNMDCELIIRKKEAFAQPPPAAPVAMMQPHQQPVLPPQPPKAHPTPPATSLAPPPSLPSPSKGSKSSHPPLKCPMAGTFYRSPAPGEPPFVKVGDKVKKGQVVCIIEAMKLMNEIEADQSGTVVEILADDGKPVSVDTPLLIIQP